MSMSSLKPRCAHRAVGRSIVCVLLWPHAPLLPATRPSVSILVMFHCLGSVCEVCAVSRCESPVCIGSSENARLWIPLRLNERCVWVWSCLVAHSVVTPRGSFELCISQSLGSLPAWRSAKRAAQAEQLCARACGQCQDWQCLHAPHVASMKC